MWGLVFGGGASPTLLPSGKDSWVGGTILSTYSTSAILQLQKWHLSCLKLAPYQVHLEAKQHEGSHNVATQSGTSSTKNSNIKGIDELHDAVVEEPVSDGGVLLDSFIASRAGLWIIRTDEGASSGHWMSAAL